MLWEEILKTFSPKRGETHAPEKQSKKNWSQLKTEAEILSEVDYVPTTIPAPDDRAKLVVFEDNEALK